MAYFNGTLHGYNSPQGYKPPIPCTERYCDACAPDNVSGWDINAPHGREHWGTAFKWAPLYGGECDTCGRSI